MPKPSRVHSQQATHTLLSQHLAVAVVIPCHNYGRFLAEAINSALAQTYRASEIIVVDDSSNDDTAAVVARYARQAIQYVRGSWKNVYQARAAGLAATRSPILCFLDADDYLHPSYVAAGMRHFSEPHVGIVYSNLRQFGDETGLLDYPPFDAGRLQRENYIHAGSLVRRTALETSGAFEADPHQVTPSHADWYVWRRVVNAGWRAVKGNGIYYYRRHSQSMIVACLNSPTENSYYSRACLAVEPVTLAILLKGQNSLWNQLAEWIDRQSWPASLIRLRMYDVSQNDAFASRVRDWLGGSMLLDVSHVRLDVARPTGGSPQNPDERIAASFLLPRVYQRIIADCSTEYVWIIEEGVIPPVDAAERLLGAFDETTASVSAAMPSEEQSPGHVAESRPQPFGQFGPSVWMDGNFHCGCIMLRRSVVQQLGLYQTTAEGPVPNIHAANQPRKEAFVAKTAWGCVCERWNVGARQIE